MFFRLRENYSLRGWEKLTCVLLDRKNGTVRAIPPKDFRCLMLCDGISEWNEPLLKEFYPILKKYEQNKVIKKTERPCQLEEIQCYKYYNNRYAGTAFWSVTGRCNYRCRHCYMDAPDAALGELPTGAALSLIDQMAECGVLRIDLTGGEPFVRADFWQLIDRIAMHRIKVGAVYTNGWLLNAKVLDAFAERGMRPQFNISFDGVGWHDWMRGRPGAERAALEAIRLCKERGLTATVSMCVHRESARAIPETIQALKQAGAHNVKISNIDSTKLWHENSEGNALSAEEYIQAMLRYIPEYFAAGRPMQVMLCNVATLYPAGSPEPYEVIAEKYDGTEDCLNCHLCGAVRSACYITPDGRLLPCMPMTACPEQELFPKIQDIGLKQGLSDSIYMRFADSRVKDLFAVNEECAACPYRLKCGGGCRASALLDGEHDLMGADRTQCMLWKNGYVEKIHQIADAAVAKYGL